MTSDALVRRLALSDQKRHFAIPGAELFAMAKPVNSTRPFFLAMERDLRGWAELLSDGPEN